MTDKIYHYIASFVFFVVAVLHVARIYYKWEADIGGVLIPVWISWAAVIIAGYLALRGWKIAKGIK